MIVEEPNVTDAIKHLFKGNKGHLSGCLKVFNKLKWYYLEYKGSEKDPVEQDISLWMEAADEGVVGDEVRVYHFAHIKPYDSEYNYSMYGQPWKLLPFHEVKFEDCEMTSEEVVATVIWELTWWGFREPEYEGLTFNFINDPNKFAQAVLNDSSYVNGRRLI